MDPLGVYFSELIWIEAAFAIKETSITRIIKRRLAHKMGYLGSASSIAADPFCDASIYIHRQLRLIQGAHLWEAKRPLKAKIC